MRLKFLFINIFLIFSFQVFSQDFEKIFKSLSFRDKIWVLENYDCVLNAIDVSFDIMYIMDSLDKAGFLGGNSEGGNFDAFRHIFWMYSIANKTDEYCARRVGEIYESYNYYIFCTTSLSGYDSVGMQMDLFNNDLGISLSKTLKDNSKVFKEIEFLLNSGQAKVIKKNKNGESLDIRGDIISDNEWKKSWNNRRTLISSH